MSGKSNPEENQYGTDPDKTIRGIQGCSSWIFALIKVAPLRVVVGLALFVPWLCFALAFVVGMGGLALELMLIMVMYGLSGLERKITGLFYADVAGFFWRVFELSTFGGSGLKGFLFLVYFIAGVLLLGSAHRKLKQAE